jgi:hypothetical protein
MSINFLGTDDLEILHTDCICLKPGFFSIDTIRELRETTLRMRPLSQSHNNPHRRWLMLSPSYVLHKSLNRTLKKDFQYLSDVASLFQFREFSAQYFEESASLNHIMSIESPLSNSAITVWHTDANSKAENPYSPDRFTLKFFIYLNDISTDNGAFAYVKGTHCIVTLIRKGIYENAIPFHKTGLPKDLIKAISIPEIKNYLLRSISLQKLDTFMEVVCLMKDEKCGRNTYDLSGPAGTLLIFDDRGIHSGGIPKYSERSILRYNYQKSKYWKESYTASKYKFNILCRFLLPRNIAVNW